MKLMLVTGAGMSRELGRDEPLPLMTDWATRLCKELDSRENDLAAAIGLRPSMPSDEFERTLGSLTTWIRARILAPSFFGLTGSNPGEIPARVLAFFDTEGSRLESIVEGLRTSLYREFGTDRIDQGIAASSYELLLELFPQADWIAIATTNYDPSAELALETLGRKPATGFHRPPARTPELAPTGLVKRTADEGGVPVLHLHGAVGWYERGGKVLEYAPDQAYNPTHGTPAVLYPDPEKDPTQDAAVKALWVEFEDALRMADRVLVCGHSLNDPVLLDVLRNTPSRQNLAVAVDTQLETEQESIQLERISALLPEAQPVPLHFGPGLEGGSAIADWFEAPVRTRVRS